MPKLTEAVQLTDPMGPESLEPAPVPGCNVCQALDKQRGVARKAGNFSMVSDCNVELRQHPHPKASRR